MASEIPSSSSPTPPANNPPPQTENLPLQFTISPSIFTNPASPFYLSKNPASPFYLPQGESPGAVLVSQPLVCENYNTWSRSMIMALTAKNKLAFVDGSLPQPAIESGAELPGLGALQQHDSVLDSEFGFQRNCSKRHLY